MSEDALLDQAAQLIADARVASLKLGIPPEEIAKIMMDEAILALMAERLSLATSSVAVDMESHIAAAAAEAHDLPFAACRVIIDPAHRALPPAALVNLRADGTPDIVAVLRSVMRQPRQLPALLRVAADARAAQLALRAGRRRLGPGLSFWGFQAAQRSMRFGGRSAIEGGPAAATACRGVSK